MSLGFRYYAPLVPPYGSKSVINAGRYIPHRAVAPATETVDSKGTYIREENSSLITGAVTDTARIEGAGLRIEPTAINLLAKTQDLSHSVWAGAPGTPETTASSATAPDGSTTAWEITDNSASFWEALQQLPTMVSNTTPIVSSAYIKKESSVLGALPGIRSRAGSTLFIVSIHPVTGVTTAITGFGTVLFHYAVDRGDWWRVVVAGANTSETITDIVLYAALATEGNPSTAVATAQGGPYTFWNPQLEQSAVASSVIPTDTASVTRSADVLDYVSTGNVRGIEGSFHCAVVPDFDGASLAGDAYVFDFTDGTDGLRGFYDQSNSGKFTVQVLSGGATVATLVASSAPVRRTPATYQVSWKANEFKLYSNGAEDATDAAGAAPAAVNASLFIGQDASNANQLGGNLCHVGASYLAQDPSVMDLYDKTVRPWVAYRVVA